MGNRSQLPGGLGAYVNRVLDGEAVLDEIALRMGQAVARTERRLVFVRLGPFSIDLGSGVISINDIKKVRASGNSGAVSLVVESEEEGFGSRSFETTLDGDLWPRVDELLELALTYRPVQIERAIGLPTHESLAQEVQERRVRVAAEQKARLDRAEDERLAHERAEASRRARLAELQFEPSLLSRFVTEGELKAVYGPMPKEDKGQATHLPWGLHYLSGISIFDATIARTAKESRRPIESVSHKVEFYDRGGGLACQLIFMFEATSQYVHWPHRAVAKIELHVDARTASHAVSGEVLGRAVVGGLLFGSTGAVVGGLSGMGGQQANRTGLLVLSLGSDSEAQCSFSVESNRVDTVRRYLVGIYGAHIFTDRQEQSLSGSSKSEVSIANELERLDSLKNRGVLTDQEFSIAKRKLLGS